MEVSIPSDVSDCGSCERHKPTPVLDREDCKTRMTCTPNGFVWAHRLEDLESFHLPRLFAKPNVNRKPEYWSPSMVSAGVKVLDEMECEDEDIEERPSLWEQVYGAGWSVHHGLPFEPKKLRVWPVVALKDWRLEDCPDELRGLVDGSVPTNSREVKEHSKALDDNPRSADTQLEEPSTVCACGIPHAKTSPQLKQPIPAHLLPEILTVTTLSKDLTGESQTRQYCRVSPPIAPSTPKNDYVTAKLCIGICSHKTVGVGNHGSVYAAHLALDERFTLLEQTNLPDSEVPIATGKRAVVEVVAKVATRHSRDQEMLAHEAKMYTEMLQREAHLSEHWSGFNVIEEALKLRKVVGNDVRVAATAVLPQFYGYYIPDQAAEGQPLMLLENCGSQIIPINLSKRQKLTCYALLERLWSAGITQGSFGTRNLVVEKGPLTLPPHLRSLDTPSFRMIDFGRGAWLSKAERQREWDKIKEDRARELKFQHALALDALYGGSRRYKYYE